MTFDLIRRSMSTKMKLQSSTVLLLSILFVILKISACASSRIPKIKQNLQTLDFNSKETWNDLIGSDHEDCDENNNKFKTKFSASGNKTLIVRKYSGRSFSKQTFRESMQFMTTPQIIAAYGYAAESYTIRTEDSYLLTVHRIPYTPTKGSQCIPNNTVLLHHGLLGSSADWVLTGPKKSLAFILSDLGYDVWLANARGNTYSRGHVTLDPNSMAFWNFTFHEIGYYDLPAVIDFIKMMKGSDSKLYYIGHSMGTTVLFALLSTRPEYNEQITKGIALAPVAYMSNIKSPIRLLAKHSKNIRYLLKLLGVKQFLPENCVLQWLSENMCELNHYSQLICENSLFVLTGHDEKQFNSTLLPIILGHVPAGASTLTLIHYAQEIQDGGRFQRFDYGPEMNTKIYDSETPPEYDIHKITLPIALISGKNDWLSSDVDATNLFVKLRYGIDHYIVPYENFNHIDFLWGIDAPTLVYHKVVEYLQNSEKTLLLDTGNCGNFTIQFEGSLLGKPKAAERAYYKPIF